VARQAFPDLNVSVEDVIAEGEKVIIRYTSRGTHQGETRGLGPPTGRHIELEGLAMQRFEESRIVEFWDRFDTLSLLQQLGLAPEQ
jgi:predicted ester cyclase